MEWINSLLSGESGSGLQLVLITLGLVIALVLIFWLFRRIAGTPARRAARNRVPRLSITDVTAVDDKRFLVLARRDNVEHLVLIGGPTDVVVESGIVRTKQAGNSQQVPKERAQSNAPIQTQAVSEPPATNAGETAVAVPAAVAATGVAAAAITSQASEPEAAEITADLSQEKIEVPSEPISEPVQAASEPVVEPDIEVEAAAVEAIDIPDEAIKLDEIDVSIDESNLEATLSDALASEELASDLEVEPVAPEAPVEVQQPETSAEEAGSSPDDEMQKLLAELASETKEPAQ